jgi:hypothetical protein
MELHIITIIMIPMLLKNPIIMAALLILPLSLH